MTAPLTDADREKFARRLSVVRARLTAGLGHEPTLVSVAAEMGVSDGTVRARYKELGLDSRAGLYALASCDRTPGTVDGAEVKRLALEKGIRLGELGELAGFGSRYTLWRLLGTAQVPSDVDLRGLSAALEVEDSDILVPTAEQERIAKLEAQLEALKS